jgi:hypothetical protein
VLERKYLAHYIDAAFDLTGEATNYVRLGKNLEELSVEMNPNVEINANILGENDAKLTGYEMSASVSPYYVSHDEALSEKLMEIIDNELTGDACKTTVVDVWLKPGDTPDAPPVVVKAIRREVVVAVQSYGGDTSGVQIPFDLSGATNRTKGMFDITTKKFTATDAL